MKEESIIPPEGIPVFQFDDGWVWTRVPGKPSLPFQICFQLWNRSLEPQLLVRTSLERHPGTLTLTRFKPPWGQGFLSSSQYHEQYRGRVLPLCTHVLNESRNLHLLMMSNAGYYPVPLTPKRFPDAWIENASMMQPEFQAMSERWVDEIADSPHGDRAADVFSRQLREKVRFLERLFVGAEVSAVVESGVLFTIDMRSRAGVEEALYLRIVPGRTDPSGLSGCEPLGLFEGPKSLQDPYAWFPDFASLLRQVMNWKSFMAESKLGAWMEAASFPGEVLIDFSTHDLLGVPHPVAEEDEVFVPWAEAFLANALGSSMEGGAS